MKCQRCGKETNVHIMSMLNTDEICMECKEEERTHPLYERARVAEHAEVVKGNYNYKGLLYKEGKKNGKN